MANIPSNLGFPVTTRSYSWADEVQRQWGAEFFRPDVAYEMSNGRKFDSTDRYTTGIYNPGIEPFFELLLDTQYPDAPGFIQLDGGQGVILLG
jgi:hypothetical protein